MPTLYRPSRAVWVALLLALVGAAWVHALTPLVPVPVVLLVPGPPSVPLLAAPAAPPALVGPAVPPAPPAPPLGLPAGLVVGLVPLPPAPGVPAVPTVPPSVAAVPGPPQAVAQGRPAARSWPGRCTAAVAWAQLGTWSPAETRQRIERECVRQGR